MATPIISGVDFIAGGARTLQRLSRRIAEHDGAITVEALYNLPAARQLQNHVDQGRPLHVLAKDLSAADDLVRGRNTRVSKYAPGKGQTAFLHSKLVAFDRGRDGTREPELWVLNRVEDTDRAEVTAIVRGKVAVVGQALIRASMAGKTDRIGPLVAEAEKLGLLINEPLAQAWPYAKENLRLVRDAVDELDIVVKEIGDTEMRRDIRQSSAKVVSIAARSAQRYGEPEPLSFISLAPSWRTNFVYGDGQATLGTAFFDSNMLGRAPNQATRDSGLLLGGKAAENARSVVHRLMNDPKRQLLMDSWK